MIARAEMSTSMHSSQQELSGSKGMSVALIGPNDTHRQIVARALSSAEGRKVHEFIDYPAQLSELPGMLEQNFDVVLVDVDTDQSYALQIIEKLAEMGPAVMAYSARNDQELLMACMRAGARDFLPLPNERGEQADAAPQPEAPISQVAPRQPETKTQAAAPSSPAMAKPAPAPRSNVTPIVAEKRFEAAAPEVTEIRPPSSAENDSDPGNSEEAFKPEPVVSDFAEWDAANLRRAQAPPVARPEARPRPSLVPERRRTEVPPSIVPKVTPPPAPVVERPPISTDIFRSADLRASDEAAERHGANWIRWILIAAGPIVLALVLLIVFTRPSSQSTTPAASKQSAASPVEQTSSTASSGQLIVDATGKPSPTTTAKPSPGSTDQAENAAPAGPRPVAADAMAAQLSAPTRIAGTIKNTADEPPPGAPTPISLDDNSSLAGSVFGGPAKAKYAPKVIAISAGVADGMVIRRTQPIYPKFAQDAHITGKIVLKATITKQGTIEGVQVMSGPKILAPSAVDAVKTWKYRPYMLDGQPISVETTISIIFGQGGR